MQQGTIAKKMDKGFGFIKIEGEEKDLFFHATELQGIGFDDLSEGDAVEFEVVDGQKGLNATNVSKV
jgi:CspA family cold shock protein